jgi:hypothetical protein
MAFGYAMLMMFLSSLPVSPTVSMPLLLAVSFFTPFMERRCRLALALLISGHATLMGFIYRDAMRSYMLGIDVFVVSALGALALPSILLNVDLLQIFEATPEPILVAVGAIAIFIACTAMTIAEFHAISAALRIIGFYKRVRKIYPRGWRAWSGKP